MLRPVAASVVIVELPDLPPKGDVSEWLARGGTLDAFRPLVAEAASKSPDETTKSDAARSCLHDRLAKNPKGIILPTHANMQLILKHDEQLRGMLQFNEFTGMHSLLRPVPALDNDMPPAPGPYPRPWDLDDVTRVLSFVQQKWAHGLSEQLSRSVLRSNVVITRFIP